MKKMANVSKIHTNGKSVLLDKNTGTSEITELQQHKSNNGKSGVVRRISRNTKPTRQQSDSERSLVMRINTQTTKCRSIGTSSGVIIPTNILKAAHINVNDSLDIDYDVNQKAIIIHAPKNNIRKGWGEAFMRLHKNGGDELLIDDVFEDEFIDE